MTEYAPPLRDIRFAFDEVCDLPDLLELDEFDHVETDMVFAVLDEVGRFAAEVIAPTNVDGDQIGARWIAAHAEGQSSCPIVRGVRLIPLH